MPLNRDRVPVRGWVFLSALVAGPALLLLGWMAGSGLLIYAGLAVCACILLVFLLGLFM